MYKQINVAILENLTEIVKDFNKFIEQNEKISQNNRKRFHKNKIKMSHTKLFDSMLETKDKPANWVKIFILYTWCHLLLSQQLWFCIAEEIYNYKKFLLQSDYLSKRIIKVGLHRTTPGCLLEYHIFLFLVEVKKILATLN